MSPIKYRYALSPSGRSISIDQIDPDNRTQHGELTCFGCGGFLIPRLGTINVNHFAHRSDGEGCGTETYLHKMSKTRIFEILQERRDQGLTVDLELKGHKRTIFVDKNGIEIDANKAPSYDPRTYRVLNTSTEIHLEHKVGDFRPDVFVMNDSGLDIFIEVFVTHPCSDEKVSSGTPIIELKIDTQEAAESVFQMLHCGHLKDFGLGASYLLVRGINFPIEDIRQVNEELAETYRRRAAKAARRGEFIAQPFEASPDLRTAYEKERDARVCKAIAEGMRTAREFAAVRETEALRYGRY